MSVLSIPSETLPLAIGAGAGLLVGIAGFILSKMKDGNPNDSEKKKGRSAKVDMASVSNDKPWELVRKFRRFMLLARWLTPTVAFIVSVWVFLFHPQPMLAVFPAWFSSYQSLDDVISLHPKNLDEAFQLGVLFQKVQSAGANVSDILGEVTRVVGRNTPVLLEQLMGLKKEIALLVEDRGIVSRMIGIFSIINIVWFVGILLVVVATGPILWLVTEPFRYVFTRFCKEIVVPFLAAMTPLYPYLATALALMFVTEASRYPTDAYSMGATMISVTGLVIAAVNYWFCTYTQARAQRSEEVLLVLSAALATVALVPVAVSTQSTLIGTAAVFACTTGLSFSFVCYGLCYLIGFADDYLPRTAYACLSLNVLFALAKAFNFQPVWTRPFAGPVAAFGGSVYFFLLLCFSLRWWYSRHRKYLLRQAPMLISLSAFYFIGTTYGIPAMVDVAHVYLVLYALQKYVDLGANVESGSMWWFYIMGAGLVLYGTAMYMNRNPQLLLGLLQGA
jgi:hypothetical protein